MSTGTAEAGRTADGDAVHAVRPGLSGPSAACGAGRITARVTGRFDAAAEDACRACAASAGA